MTETLPAAVIYRDVRIPLGDNDVTLSADLYLPAGDTPAPVLVTVVPYRKDLGTGYEPSLTWFAEQGYAAVLVEQRGIGSSDGLPRAKYDDAEAEDAVRAIEWAAAQPWSNGRVGMWGMSYGGHMTLRAAAMRPPALKAIIPMMCTLDSGRDIAHPAGVRGDFLPVALWGGSMLAQQLLPGLVVSDSEAEQRRWRRRLYEIEPHVMDIARTGPGDDVWSCRAIDPTRIEVPAMCVGGWQDVFTDAVPELYERIRAPKRLIMGPWGHVLPQESRLGAIDFLPLAERWWDHWLRDEDNGVMEEPSAVVFVPGGQPQWRGFPNWPPPAPPVRLHGAPGGALTAECRPETRLGATCPDDTTVGALSGLRAVGMGDFGLPRDQHDDDVRALAYTTEPLPEGMLIAGRAEILVRLQDGPPAGQWVAVRLTEVDPRDRSTIITSGVLVFEPRDGADQLWRLSLDTAVRQIPAGHRLRIVLSQADLPRLNPQPHPRPLQLDALTLTVPAADADIGFPYEMKLLEPSGPVDGTWTVERDLVTDKVTVRVGERRQFVNADGHRIETDRRCRIQHGAAEPQRLTTTSVHRTAVRLVTGRIVRVVADVRCTADSVRAKGTVTVDGAVVFTRVWTASLGESSD